MHWLTKRVASLSKATPSSRPCAKQKLTHVTHVRACTYPRVCCWPCPTHMCGTCCAQARLKHVDTGFFLYSHDARFGNPIAGQFEVCAFKQKNANAVWQAAEGVYLPQPQSEDGDDKEEL
jgi:hypothetical protein